MLTNRLTHTQIPNDLLDNMDKLSHIGFKVIMLICRKTIGWHKEVDSISVSQIVKHTGLSKNSVLRSITELEDMGVIVVDRVDDNKTTNKYTLAYPPAEAVPQRDGGWCLRETGGGAPEGRGVVPERDTQKKVLNKDKENISPPPVKKKESIKSPILFEKFWDTYGKKTGKNNTIKEWNKLSTDDQRVAVDKVSAYVKDRPDPKYRKDPERYLKNRLFEDEILSTPKQPAFKDYV